MYTSWKEKTNDSMKNKEIQEKIKKKMINELTEDEDSSTVYSF